MTNKMMTEGTRKGLIKALGRIDNIEDAMFEARLGIPYGNFQADELEDLDELRRRINTVGGLISLMRNVLMEIV